MPIRLLIADDNPVVRTALHQLLERAGDWEIVDAENGREAIAKAQEFAPNLIILDLVMPVMDGLAAARELSKLTPQTPLLMHTLHWSPQVEVEAQKVGVRKVVPKADSKGLISAIRHYLTTEPQGAPTAAPEGMLPFASASVATSSVAASSISPSPIPVPNAATPDITALPPLLDHEAETEKSNEAVTASPAEKPDTPQEPGNLPSQLPTP